MKRSLVPVAVLLVLSAQLSGQTVTLWNSNPPPNGRVTREELTMTLEKGSLLLDVNNQTLHGIANALVRDSIERQIVGTDQQKIEVLDSSRSIRFSFGNVDSPPKEEAGKLFNKKLLGKRTNGHWTYTLAGKQQPEPAEATALKQFAGYTEAIEAFGLLYGTQPRKVGETWKPDISAMKKLTTNIDADLECKLEDVKSQGGDQLAHISVKGRFFAGIGNGANVQVAINGVIERSLRDMVDLSTEVNGNFRYTGELGKGKDGQKANDASIEAPVKISRTVKIVKR